METNVLLTSITCRVGVSMYSYYFTSQCLYQKFHVFGGYTGYTCTYTRKMIVLCGYLNFFLEKNTWENRLHTVRS